MGSPPLPPYSPQLPLGGEYLSCDTCGKSSYVVWENKGCLCRAHACPLTFPLCRPHLQRFPDLLSLMGRQPCRCHLSSQQTWGDCKALLVQLARWKAQRACVCAPKLLLVLHITCTMDGVCNAMPLSAATTPRKPCVNSVAALSVA